MPMDPFEIDESSFLEGFRELEEGIYVKNYGMELREEQLETPELGLDDFGAPEAKALAWQKRIDETGDCLALKAEAASALGQLFPDQQALREICLERGILQPGCGASMDDLIVVLGMDDSGLEDERLLVEVIDDCGFAEFLEYVDSDSVVFCHVSMPLIDVEGLQDLPGLNADGFLQVIGVRLDPEGEDCVVVNDASKEEGAGMKISLDRFMRAWSTSAYRMLSVTQR